MAVAIPRDKQDRIEKTVAGNDICQEDYSQEGTSTSWKPEFYHQGSTTWLTFYAKNVRPGGRPQAKLAHQCYQ